MDFGLLMDAGVNTAFQNLCPPVTSVFSAMVFLDTLPWYILLISLLYFGLHPRYGIRLAVLTGLACGMNEALKLFFHSPRPYWVSPAVKAFSAHSSFGLPSGAAMYGVVVYGYIASVIRRWWAILICSILLICASLARIFAGIHFPLDLIGGFCLGLILLLAYLLAGPAIEAWARRLSRPARVAAIIAVAAIPICLAIPASLSLAGWQVPAAWIEFARQQTGSTINPLSTWYSWGASGFLLGTLLGYELLGLRGGWIPPVEMKRRVVVVLAGTVSVFLINLLLVCFWVFSGLVKIIPEPAAFLSMACVMFWLTAGVPLMARKAGFYGEEQSP